MIKIIPIQEAYKKMYLHGRYWGDYMAKAGGS